MGKKVTHRFSVVEDLKRGLAIRKQSDNMRAKHTSLG